MKVLRVSLGALALAGLAFPVAGAQLAVAAPAPSKGKTHHVVYRISTPFLGISNVYYTGPKGRVRVNLAADPDWEGDDWEMAVDIQGPVLASVLVTTVADVPTNSQSCEIEVDGEVAISRVGPPPMPALPGPAHTWAIQCKQPIDVPAEMLPMLRPDKKPDDFDEINHRWPGSWNMQ
ncbi:MAG: hypothetical protein ACRC20_05435 [Segniliparus sp.]|uniref:hypothetical protein n=1 Tax=Segniliparus sp. TaxID=2804064 RepID=UPI003F340BC2